MTGPIIRALFPAVLMVSLALLIKGHSHVGDGFSAGALAGLAASLVLTTREPGCRRLTGARFARAFACAGLVLAEAVALAPFFAGAAPVTHLPRPGEPLIEIGSLPLHTTLLFDAGIALLVYGVIVAAFDRVFGAAA